MWCGAVSARWAAARLPKLGLRPANSPVNGFPGPYPQALFVRYRLDFEYAKRRGNRIKRRRLLKCGTYAQGIQERVSGNMNDEESFMRKPRTAAGALAGTAQDRRAQDDLPWT